MLLLTLSLMLSQAINMPTCTRDAIKACALHFVDANHDETVTVAEIDAFMGAQRALANGPGGSCMTRSPDHFFDMFTGAFVMEMCDIDHDAVLTIGDWTGASNVTAVPCLQQPSDGGAGMPTIMQRYMCTLCHECGAPLLN